MRHFAAVLDGECARRERRIWLEKTPDHLFYIGTIARHLPHARFVHIIRDGEEVVTSLRDAACRHPEWRGQADIDHGVERWNRAVRESLRWTGHPQHLLVRYEGLLQHTEPRLQAVLAFLRADPRAERRDHAATARDLVAAGQPWKQANFEPLQDRRRFSHSFPPAERARILDRLHRIDWTALAASPGVLA